MNQSASVPSLYDIVLGSISNQAAKSSIDHSLLLSLPETLLPSLFERCCQDGHLTSSLLMAFRPYLDSFIKLSLNQAISQSAKHNSTHSPQPLKAKLALNDLVFASILPRLTSLMELDLTRNLTITRLSLPRPELLQSINLSGCRSLKDSQIAPLISQAINLTDIDLSGAAIGDLTVFALSEGRACSQSTTNNYETSISQQFPDSSSSSITRSKVQRLNLSGCLVYHGLKQFLSICPPLVSLNVSQTWFDSSEFETINMAGDTLTDLNLEFSMKLKDSALINLHECKRLQFLNLARNASVSAPALRALCEMSELNKLFLGGQDVQDADFSSNFSLTELDFQRCVTFNDRVALTLTPLKQITHLSLQYTSLSNSFIPFLIRSFPCLVQLKLTRTRIDDIGIRALFTPWSVPEADLGEISSIPDFVDIIHQSTSHDPDEEKQHVTVPVFVSTLERLDIGGEKLTDACIPAVGEGLIQFPRLSYLGIWTSSITASAIAPLLSQPRARSTYTGGLVEALRADPTFSTDSLYDDVDSSSSTAPSSPRNTSSQSIPSSSHRFVLDPTMNSSVGTYVLVASDSEQ